MSEFYEKLDRGDMAIVVELDPPAASDIAKYMDCARDLKRLDIDLMTLADSPSGRPRVSSMAMAAKVSRELEIETLPHITCRDRNGVALRSELMGLAASGVDNALLVTGDPMGEEQKCEGYKPVFEYNSRTLAAAIKDMEKDGTLAKPLNLFGALNVNAANFAAELDRAKEKIAAGMIGLFTQPVLSEEAVLNLQLASKELECFIFGGIMPLTSEKNAQFVNDHIAGITVDPDIILMYTGLKKDEASKLAIELSGEFAHRITPYIDGYFIMTPFLRTDLTCEIIKQL